MSKVIPVFTGNVENGGLFLDNHHAYREYLKGISGRVELLVRPPKKHRTRRQNNYYWACLEIISEATGHTKDELHLIFKQAFLPIEDKKFNIPISTTKLSREAFVEYMDRIKAMVHPIKLPDPNGYEYLTPYGH